MLPLISFQNVTYRYSQGERETFLALNGISLEINEGEWVAVVGANGSGKSTFARLANALLLPQEGRVLVAGFDTRQPDQRGKIHASVGMVFQFPEDQIVATTVEEDVAFGPENLGLSSHDIRERVDEALHEVGLWEQRARPSHMLSAGQIQRLALAGVLAMRPRCIIFDEASTMLDPAGRAVLLDSMRRLNQQGTTIIFITHFMEEAVLAGRVVVFDRGRIALDGRPADIFADPRRLEALRLELPPAARASMALRPLLAHIRNSSEPHDFDEILTLPDLLALLPAYPGHSGMDAPGPSAPGQKTLFLLQSMFAGWGTPICWTPPWRSVRLKMFLCV
jgi:energy-coupling factor transporter ATPase